MKRSTLFRRSAAAPPEALSPIGDTAQPVAAKVASKINAAGRWRLHLTTDLADNLRIADNPAKIIVQVP